MVYLFYRFIIYTIAPPAGVTDAVPVLNENPVSRDLTGEIGIREGWKWVTGRPASRGRSPVAK